MAPVPFNTAGHLPITEVGEEPKKLTGPILEKLTTLAK